jgi:spartin
VSEQEQFSAIMSAGHSEPQVLYSVNNIRAFHLQDGQETELTPSGPQTLSLLMVPTSSPFADASSEAPEEDFYLHLHLPPELDQPLPATTQIYHKPPNSYLIPRWDLGPDAGAFIRIEFPSIGRSPGKVTQEDVDTFETILAQCTAFLERAAPPSDHGSYNPAAYAPGEGYISSGQSDAPPHGQIVLIDEENGSVVGELQQGYSLSEAADVRPGSKSESSTLFQFVYEVYAHVLYLDPVEIQLPGEGQGNSIRVTNADEEYLRMARHPAYAKSTIVQTSARASRLIVTGSPYLAKTISNSADNFQKKVEPNPKPMTFSKTTHQRLRQIHGLTQGAVGLSAKTVGQVSRYAQNFGATMARKSEKERQKKGFKDGQPDPNYKPGMLNKSMMAFSTIADGIDQAGRNLLASGSSAATTVVGHKYGPEAGKVASNLAGGVRNVGLVYIDAAGVSRKAIIKSVAKGMVVGKMPNGQQIVVGTGDGGVVPPEAYPADVKRDEKTEMGYGGGQQAGVSAPRYGVESYGNAAAQPPAYSGVGEPLGGHQGQYMREKH